MKTLQSLLQTEWHMSQPAGWFPQQQLQTLLGVAVGVTSYCALCQGYHRGNLHDVNYTTKYNVI